MIEFNIAFRGKGAVIKSLVTIKDAMTRRSTLKTLADEARALIKARTLEGQDENDSALIPSRRVKMHGGQTLSDKDHMLGSMRVLSATKDRAVIGFGSMTEAKKAWWAQDGTKTKKGKVKSPKRPFFGISPRDNSDLQAFAENYIRKVVRDAEAGR